MKVKMSFDDLDEAILEWMAKHHPSLAVDEESSDWKWSIAGDEGDQYPNWVEFAVRKDDGTEA